MLRRAWANAFIIALAIGYLYKLIACNSILILVFYIEPGFIGCKEILVFMPMALCFMGDYNLLLDLF